VPNASHSVREEIRGVLLFVGCIWIVYLVSILVPGIHRYGVIPRTTIGLVGIPAMPFLHANLHHLLSNTAPLLILLVLLSGSRAESWEVVASITFLGGGLLWVFGRPAVHIGASGLVSGLATFLILAGFLEQRIVPLVIAIAVGFLYGGSVLLGVLPRLHSSVSWEGHLFGAIAGAIVAYALTWQSRQPSLGRRAQESGSGAL
jgi:membrane associated rhomboid family serine protease